MRHGRRRRGITAAAMHRVGFLPRLAAFLIDLGIFTVAVHLFTAVDVLINLATPLNYFGIVSLLGGSVLLLGYGFLEVLLAATPGKKLAGLVIASDDGQPATRRTLLKRWAAKHIPVFFAAPMMLLWAILSPYNYRVILPDYVIPGIFALAVIDTILTGLLLLMVVGGCFLALLPARTTLHDKLAGTAVYPAADLNARHSFEAVVRATAASSPSPGTPGEGRGEGLPAGVAQPLSASARTAYPTSPTPQQPAQAPQNTSV
jgi:uncharacterized RDD family membrane protein YckC